MRILTTENKTYPMNVIPDEVEDIRYAVLDYSNPKEVDFYFIPLMFLDQFNSPAVELKIGKHIIQMPMDWSVIIGEKFIGDLESIELTGLNDRGFEAFCFNPITSGMPEWMEIDILNVYPDVKWYFPKLKHGHILTVPLSEGENPLCAYFVRETSKIPERLDVSKVVI